MISQITDSRGSSNYLKRVQADHAEFIDVIYYWYEVLIDLHYFQEDEVVYPPYNVPGKPSLATSELKHLGFTDEVVALMELLPYPSNILMNKFAAQHEGVPIAPDSAVVSYLADSDMMRLKTSRQPFCDGEVGIPAWAFKITACGLDFGTSYLYDTRSRLMVRWAAEAQFGDYADQNFRSPRESGSIFVGELRSLDWLPWRVKHGGSESMNVYSRPAYKQHMSSLGSTNRYCLIEDDDQGGLAQTTEPSCDTVTRKLEIAKAVQNRYIYKRNLYEDCGWPTGFDGEEFERRRADLDEEFYHLMGELGPRGMHIQDLEDGKRLREWYKEKAGHNAVC